MTSPRYEYDEAGEMLVENDGSGGVRVVAFRVLPSFGRWAAARSAPAPDAERLLPTFEVGQVVGDLQPGRRRHDWCSAHGDIGPAESITAHAVAAHGSTPEQIRKARKVIARAAALKGARP